jgi:hypothetical protein
MTEHTKFVIDLSSLVVAWGAVLSYLPDVAAALSIIWTLMRFYEWLRRKRRRR